MLTTGKAYTNICFEIYISEYDINSTLWVVNYMYGQRHDLIYVRYAYECIRM